MLLELEERKKRTQRTIGWKICVIERPLSNINELTDAISLVLIERFIEGRRTNTSFFLFSFLLFHLVKTTADVNTLTYIATASTFDSAVLLERTPPHILVVLSNTNAFFSSSSSLDQISTASDDGLNERVCRVLVFLLAAARIFCELFWIVRLSFLPTSFCS